MNSAASGLSANLSESLNDVLDLASGVSGALYDTSASVPATESDSAAYAGIGVEAGEASFSAATIEVSIDSSSSGDLDSAGMATLDAFTGAGSGAGGDYGDAASDFAPAGPPSAPGPAVSLQTLANYLTSGYWTDTGRTSRWYNVDDNGTGANFGTLYYNISGYSGDANGLTAARQTMAREAFKIYSEVLGINFVETTSTSTSVDFFFKDNAGGAANSSTVYAGTGGAIDFSTINVDVNWNGGSSTIGDYTFQTFLHEIGHALGLGHQGDYNGSGSFGTDALYENDSWALSMMSYFDQLDNTASSTSGYDYARLISPMSVDWLALNDLYDGQDYVGRSFGVNQALTGNTVWGFNTNISSATSAAFASIASLADTNAFTIVDGGGIDTVDFSGFAADQTINLLLPSTGSTLGSVSNIGGLTGNMTIAVGTVIENAVGGSGDDQIYGNDVGNVLTGNAGNDTIKGFGGGDTLYGGAGNDTLFGDDGADAIYGGIGNDVIRMGESGGGDYVQGDDGDDTIYWGAPSPSSARTVYGGAGVDTINGGGTVFGAVTFDLGAGTYNNGGAFTETWSGFENYNNVSGTGSEIVRGTGGDNLIQLGSGNNQAYGGGGTDTLYGGAGDDTLEGGFVTDDVYGGDGNDTLRVQNGEFYDNSYGGAGTDTLDHALSSYGGSTFDFELGTITGSGINGVSAVLSSIETYYDGSGANTIISDGNSNTYYGGGGDDTMIAEIGGEFMYGGAGTDLIDLTRWSGTYIVDMGTGSSNYGSETFQQFENLNSGAGNDTITGNSSFNIINTGAGNDRVIDNEAQDDNLNGGTGVDTLVSDLTYVDDATFNMLTGLAAFSGGTFLHFTNFENITVGGAADIIGDNGNNFLTALDDVLSGNNTIEGNGGVDVITTGAGNDNLYGGTGNDQLYAGAGNDYTNGGLGDDRIDGGAGQDRIDYSAAGSALYIDLRVATQTATGGLGTDVITTIEEVVGGAFADTLIGNADVNSLFGGAGTDSLVTLEGDDFAYGGAGDDYIAGRDGNDTLFGDDNNDVIDGAAGLDLLRGNAGDDYIIGGDGGDAIYGGDGGANVGDIGDRWLGGDGGDDNIFGNLGTDRLSGGAGNDNLTGGEGYDYMTGEAGIDTFIYNALSEGSISEQIGDWQGGIDKLQIDASAFGGGLAAGALAANRLVIGTVANQAFGQFLYNSGNGVLYWDADGTGAGAATAFTRLFTTAFTLPPASLAATDFLLVA